MSDRPSLAAPLSKALEAEAGFKLVSLSRTSNRILAALRSDPDVLAAMAEALPRAAVRPSDPNDQSTIAERLLDALFGTLGAGPIASGEGAE